MFKEVNEITNALESGETIAKLDRLVFKKYIDGNYTLRQALDAFRYNNHIADDIEPAVFETWLASIGWRKK